jgi:tRNA A-37 threonylcarbamoyl transferase component Bud32
VGDDVARSVLERMRSVEMRGRYIAARRSVWRG